MKLSSQVYSDLSLPSGTQPRESSNSGTGTGSHRDHDMPTGSRITDHTDWLQKRDNHQAR